MKRILVSGAGGRLGSQLTKRLSDLGYSQILLTSEIPNTKLLGAEYILCDWSNLTLPDLRDVELVVHLAHQTSAYLAKRDVEADITTNVISTVRIVEAVKQSKTPPDFIYMGSLTEYGSNNKNPIKESVQRDSVETFYDCSKLAAELYLKQFQNEGVLRNLTLLRLGNLYGFLGGNQVNHRGFFDNAIYSAYLGKELVCFGEGNFLRDFIHIDDVINALVALIESKGNSSDGKFNLASGIGYTIKDALSQINNSLRELGKSAVFIRHELFPEGAYGIEQRNHIADISLIVNRIGWKPSITLSEGIIRSLKYYIQNESRADQIPESRTR